ncbi:sigma-70 family RNA polymerase sigma factor [Candidatus Pantoea multigeneris]|uniref:Sigma-70 family RNA polymerase sigma factor n=1 Tax=Candidatus Pantoea multigeneris TaxID=2608357 RepID=A0ABX0RED7_9GAMM|nr:sigma-70 family RNA polymerase sigma factor [Pantoea multigeneris]NIF23722.1 sigma-70 family RNA polymerase sigma factor [Pantoea multigeneris]
MDEQESWPVLMARAQAGDQTAYNQLLHALVPVIRALARKKIYDDALTEDVVQEALITVHHVRHTYDPTRPFMPWLAAIVRARAVDALRKNGRHLRWEVQDDEADAAVASHEPAAEQEEVLEHALHQLPLRQREMVEMVHLRELSLAEAALQHNLSVSAVKSLLHRALLNLRRLGGKDRERS